MVRTSGDSGMMCFVKIFVVMSGVFASMLSIDFYPLLLLDAVFVANANGVHSMEQFSRMLHELPVLCI